MSLFIVSDESGFPQMALKSVCLLYGYEESMNELRSSLIKHLENTSTQEVKWSKMRAKKKYLASIMQILTLVYERKKTQNSNGIWAGLGTDCLQLYKIGMKRVAKKGNRIFTPDKNLSLKRHTDHHIFAKDERFDQIIPLTVRQEPLIIIADILAGIFRESRTMRYFHQNPETMTYIPDKYKIIVAQQSFSLGLFSE